MAFNFHWSPLTADSLFYSRAQALLTAALNKSPKPPIIVDDILVNELNLGSVPPELEILEIGDLADDRFRGIFKMCYSGDAFLTLKTRVQANPLNTYLSTKPSFTSPEPLAAASGLTIPLKITLSEIRLSAFIILVFSKQKGLTLVFRNDPLESLKVSSTFDSIPFVRDYLQKEIEGQLRYLLMEELPAIIHRLSLRLCVPEIEMRGEGVVIAAKDSSSEPKPIDPLASNAPGPTISDDYGLESSELLPSPIDVNVPEAQSVFSQKNLVRLTALSNSHRTLSLFTPSIRDAVFRAWAGASERGDAPGANTPATPYAPSLSRSHSYSGSTSSTYVFSEPSQHHYFAPRPSLTSFHSAMSGLSLGAGRHSRAHPGRKRKTRVVNLRRPKPSAEETVSKDPFLPQSDRPTTPEMVTSEKIDEREEDLITPPRSPKSKVGTPERSDNIDLRTSPSRLRPRTPTRSPGASSGSVNQGTQTSPDQLSGSKPPSLRPTTSRPGHVSSEASLHPAHLEKALLSSFTSSERQVTSNVPQATEGTASQYGILERALMAKIAGEVARRVSEEKRSGRGVWHHNDHEDAPPPAYEVQ